MRGYLPDFLELPDLPIPRRVTQFPVGPSESSAQPRKRQRRAAGFSRLGVGTISSFPNPRTIAREFSARFRTFRASQLAHANFLGRKLNFPNLTTSNRVDQGSEGSISCHFQLPRCIYPRKARFRAICTKPPAHSDTRAFSRCASVRIRKTPVCSRFRALAQTPALPLPCPLPKRRRDGICAPSRLSASRYLNRPPLWARPLSVGFRMPSTPSGCGRHPVVGRFASFAAHW